MTVPTSNAPETMVGTQAPETGAMRQVIIEASNVSKTYRSGQVQVRALRELDIRIERGEMVAIMGPSGCGKTTLLNSLSGLDSIDSGSILIAGTDLARLSDDDRTAFRARHMGFVFQFYNLLPVLSAVENVELPLLVSDVPADVARRQAREGLAQVGLDEWAHHRPAELSGGQRQRVTIARALVNLPAIVWADEPTGDLDSRTADEVMALLKQLNEENQQTFVIVTHDPQVGDMCDRVIHMQDGQIIDDGNAVS